MIHNVVMNTQRVVYPREAIESCSRTCPHDDERRSRRCLLLWSSVDWTFRKHSCSGAEPTSLQEGSVADQSWKLLSWQPGPGSGDLRLALADGRRASFRLQLAADGTQILGISDVQLIGRDRSEPWS